MGVGDGVFVGVNVAVGVGVLVAVLVAVAVLDGDGDGVNVGPSGVFVANPLPDCAGMSVTRLSSVFVVLSFAPPLGVLVTNCPIAGCVGTLITAKIISKNSAMPESRRIDSSSI